MLGVTTELTVPEVSIRMSPPVELEIEIDPPAPPVEVDPAPPADEAVKLLTGTPTPPTPPPDDRPLLCLWHAGTIVARRPNRTSRVSDFPMSTPSRAIIDEKK
jgi:hypothetical protein